MVAFEIKTIKSEAKRVPRPFEPFGLYQVKIEESEFVTETDSALNNDQLLSTNHSNLMHWMNFYWMVQVNFLLSSFYFYPICNTWFHML